jgi:hypothetical protein
MCPEREPGIVRRPKPTVLDESALVPGDALVKPPPNRFTHELVRDEPFRFGTGDEGEPAGTLPAGTPVVLLRDGPEGCRVVDGRGLYVRVRRESLRGRDG